MALNISKCNHMMPLRFKGLTVMSSESFSVAMFRGFISSSRLVKY